MKEKPLIIFDTDMDTDCDDAGALLMLINAHLSGDIALMGVICDSVCEYAAPYCRSVLDYYNLSIPVGEIYAHIEDEGRFSSYKAHQKHCESQAYNRMLSEKAKPFASSSEVYKSLLKDAPPRSVTILCVGMLTSIFELMRDNVALFEEKVEKIVIMGNPYKKNDFNFSMDAVATKGFFEICPCPVFVSYLGGEIITGNHLSETLEPSHPVRRAYEIWTLGKGRSSWDLIAALYAMDPSSDLFKITDTCRIEYNEIEKTSSLAHGTRDNIITLNCSNEQMQEILNGLLR